MKTVVLLMCGKNKLPCKAKVKDLYTSGRFRKSIEYAETLTTKDNIFVLSAKHGVLDLDREIEPYNKSIYKMNSDEKNEWANMVIAQLESRYDINNDRFVFLTDDYYNEPIYPKLKNFELPLKSMDQKDHWCWFNNKLEKE
jgi:hypothetical protein